MKPARVPLHIKQGATFSKVFTINVSPDTALDLTGWTARMKARERVGGTQVFSLTSAGGDIELGGEAGTVTVTISDEATAAYDFEYAVWDLELETPAGEVLAPCGGPLVLIREITV